VQTQSFVAALYQDVFGRTADAPGLDRVTSSIQAGASRQATTASFLSQREHLGRVVDGFYATYLHRAADPGGRAFWIDQLASGVSEDAVAASFLVSAEYTASHASNEAFIAGLYRDVLGREADATGLNNNVAALAAGRTRAELVALFLTCDERYVRVINQSYGLYLDRAADPTGLASYLAKLRSGELNARSLAATLAASDEYFAKAYGG
jgi:hypothetical protein